MLHYTKTIYDLTLCESYLTMIQSIPYSLQTQSSQALLRTHKLAVILPLKVSRNAPWYGDSGKEASIVQFAPQWLNAQGAACIQRQRQSAPILRGLGSIDLTPTSMAACLLPTKQQYKSDTVVPQKTGTRLVLPSACHPSRRYKNSSNSSSSSSSSSAPDSTAPESIGIDWDLEVRRWGACSGWSRGPAVPSPPKQEWATKTHAKRKSWHSRSAARASQTRAPKQTLIDFSFISRRIVQQLCTTRHAGNRPRGWLKLHQACLFAMGPTPTRVHARRNRSLPHKKLHHAWVNMQLTRVHV